MSTTPEQRITQAELENYLWGAAVLLRGLIDAGDYKGYIFPLVFLKRVSDVWDEERASALAEYEGDEELAALPENHRFVIPDGCHWSDVRATTTSVGTKLRAAMGLIEAANPDSLDGVFGDADWTNKDLLSDATLIGLVEHFSTRTLSIANLPEDELGNGYEFLIKRFADDSGHTAQEFYTNRTLVHLMAQMLAPQPGESVYDPTCGTGGMLISCADEVRRQGKEHRSLGLFGQERNFTTASVAKMNLFLHGIEDGHIACADTLADPYFLNDSGGLRTFDVVLANPPYSIKTWDRARFTADPYGRNMWGVPPQGRADYAFFQHIAASVNPKTGRAAILFPHGVLFRQEEKDLRANLVASGLLEAVIGLGPGLFYNSPMEAVVVTLRATRPDDQAGTVLFIDGKDLFERRDAQSFLGPDDQKTILAAYQGFTDIDGLAAVASPDDIKANDFSLAIPMYVAPPLGDDDDQPTIDEVLTDWRAAAAAADEAVLSLLDSLRQETTSKGEDE
jgi:type I restriction enzyme M protein